jgi:hypothetical protein
VAKLAALLSSAQLHNNQGKALSHLLVVRSGLHLLVNTAVCIPLVFGSNNLAALLRCKPISYAELVHRTGMQFVPGVLQ